MQTLELPLFPIQQSPPEFTIQPKGLSSNPQASIEQALNAIFPQQAEENKISKTRRNLGETAKTLSDEQIECINAEFQFLIDTWLDEYEKDVFEGMTLKEIINEK